MNESETNRDLMSLKDINTMAYSVAKSGMFPGIDTPEQAFTLMMICQSEGIHPMQAMARYSIIKGRPAWKSIALNAAFRNSGGTVTFKERTDTKCEAVFEIGEEPAITIVWTIEMAKAAGLYPNKDNWKCYPRQMLTARVLSEGINLIAPHIAGGFHTAEEIVDTGEPAGGNVQNKKTRPAKNRITELAKLSNNLLIEPETSESDKMIEEINNSMTIAELDRLVKVENGIIISSLSDAEKEKIKAVYKTRLKTLAFAGTSSQAVTPESSEVVKAKLLKQIEDGVSDKVESVIIESKDILVPDDFTELSAAFIKAREAASKKNDITILESDIMGVSTPKEYETIKQKIEGLRGGMSSSQKALVRAAMANKFTEVTKSYPKASMELKLEGI